MDARTAVGTKRRVGRSPAKKLATPRMSARSGNLTLRIEPTRAAAAAAASIGFAFQVNPWILQSLENEAPLDGRRAEHLDETVVAFAAYQNAREKLEGNAAVAIRNKVTATCCGAQGGEFVISVTTDKSLTSVRRCAMIALQAMRFRPLFQRYSTLCRSINVKPSQEGFDFAATSASKALRAGVTVVVTGRVTAKPDIVEKSAVALAKRIKDSEPKAPGKPRTVEIDAKEKKEITPYNSLPAPGLDGIIMQNYAETGIKGARLHLHGGRLWFPKSKERSIRALADNEKIARYAKQLAKLGGEIRGALVFVAARHCAVPTASLNVTGAMTEESVKAALQKMFRQD